MKKFLSLLLCLTCLSLFAESDSVKKYLAAAKAGDAYAQYNLGVCYYNGYGVTQDKSQAVYWYRKAADQGHDMAQFNLGVCYYNGYGVTQDKSQAVYWLKKAADQGNASAKKALEILGY